MLNSLNSFSSYSNFYFIIASFSSGVLFTLSSEGLSLGDPFASLYYAVYVAGFSCSAKILLSPILRSFLALIISN